MVFESMFLFVKIRSRLLQNLHLTTLRTVKFFLL